jgi:gamma-glutamyl-gamma-aminobutyrate hydrolase PuuD
VEGATLPGKPVVGIMWHPERERSPAAHDVALFRDVFLGGA